MVSVLCLAKLSQKKLDEPLLLEHLGQRFEVMRIILNFTPVAASIMRHWIVCLS